MLVSSYFIEHLHNYSILSWGVLLISSLNPEPSTLFSPNSSKFYLNPVSLNCPTISSPESLYFDRLSSSPLQIKHPHTHFQYPQRTPISFMQDIIPDALESVLNYFCCTQIQLLLMLVVILFDYSGNLLVSLIFWVIVFLLHSRRGKKMWLAIIRFNRRKKEECWSHGSGSWNF